MATRRRSRPLAGALIAAAFAAQGCAVVQAPVVPPVGWGFTYYSAPVETNFSATPVGSKVGKAESRYLYFWLPFQTYVPIEFGFGDAAVKQAAKNGGITTIHYVDYEYLRVLGFYQQVTVLVSGD